MPPKYGRPHRRVRLAIAPYVADGTVACVRCGNKISPGEPWDLGHVDGNPSVYAGPEHARCNRATATHAAARRKSRVW